MFEKNKIYKVVCIKNLKPTQYVEFVKGKTYNLYMENKPINLRPKEESMWVYEDTKNSTLGYRFYSKSNHKLEDYFSSEKEIRKEKLKKINYEKD
jgi:hypothetical protein